MTNLEEIKEYCEQCIAGTIPSGQKHIWACERFLGDLKRIGDEDFPYIWDEDEAQRIVDWFALLRHVKGDLARQPIRLTSWQKFRECQIYGWRHKQTGRKRFTKAFTEVARKNAKSQMEAGEALYNISVEAAKNGEVNEVYTAGAKREQSKIVFNEADLMTRGTVLRSKFKINRESIEHIKSGSYIKALSKEDKKTGDGTNPSLLILDEYHQHSDTGFYDLTMGSNRKEPMLSIITTAGTDLSYPCYTQEYDYCTRLLDPSVDVQNDAYFADIMEAEDGDDPGALDTWKKANPIRAFFPGGVKAIAEEWKIAKDVPDKLIGFKTKMLDVWVLAKKHGYMDMAKWKACEVKEPPVPLGKTEKKLPCYVGFDMSARIDLTSVAFIVPYQEDENGRKVKKYFLWSHSFIPNQEKLQEHVKSDKVPYDSWITRGYLTMTDTPIVDQTAVMEYVEKQREEYNLDLKCLCFDPANAAKIMLDLSNEGYTVEEVFQSHKSLNESTCTFREQVYAGNVTYTHNPLLNFAMSNAVTRTSNGLTKIDKDATAKRIDPVDATLCAFKLALYHDFDAPDPNEYVQGFIDGIL